ncbi:MAG: hypothetical protein EOP50_19685 [Sphingobacteriales bacterium]|nr:MAG: hypothetical protein EOP50_19685 [Sphingobacteriales bacterium]
MDQSLLMPDNGFNINTPDIKTDPLISESLDPEPLSSAQRLNFRLQACEINQWVILVNESDLQQPELRKLLKVSVGNRRAVPRRRLMDFYSGWDWINGLV